MLQILQAANMADVKKQVLETNTEPIEQIIALNGLCILSLAKCWQ